MDILEKILREEIFDEPALPNDEIRAINCLLARALQTSDQPIREALFKLLEKWKLRVLFVDATQELDKEKL